MNLLIFKIFLLAGGFLAVRMYVSRGRALGVDRFIVVGPSMDAEQDEARLAQKMFVGEVLPAIREVADAA